MAVDLDAQAKQIRDRYNARVADIRGRRDLSDDGRRRQLAAAKVDAGEKLKAIRQQVATNDATRRDQLVRSLFGQSVHGGADALSVRDALTRADQLKGPDEAAALLRLARVSGDTVLARAVGARAYEGVRSTFGRGREQWGRVLDDWTGGREDTAADVDGLMELDGIGVRGSADLTARFMANLATSVARPAELSGVANLDGLARDADAHPGEDEPPEPAGWFRFNQPVRYGDTG